MSAADPVSDTGCLGRRPSASPPWSSFGDKSMEVAPDFDERVVAYIGRDTLIRNKRAAARPKDLSDIDALERGADS